MEALAVSTTFLVGSVALDNVRSLHTVVAGLPVHYWLRWTQLFHDTTGGGGLLLGLAVQAATVAVALGAGYVTLGRRDPAA